MVCPIKKTRKNFSGNEAERASLRQPLDKLVLCSKKLCHSSYKFQEGRAADLAKIIALIDQLSMLLNEISELNSDTVHDLRTPLNGIIGYCEMLLEEGDEQSPDLQDVLSEAREFQRSLETLLRSKTSEKQEVEKETSIGARDAMIRSTIESIAAQEGTDFANLTQKGGSILVVDDNEINRDLLSSQLERQGHKVTLAANGREALDIISKENIDLMLLDIMMPEMNGYAVLEFLRSTPNSQEIAIIVVSALDAIASVVRCIQLGAADYLLKPFNPVLLNARINGCLEMKRLKDRSEALRLGGLVEEVPFIAESKIMQNVLNTVTTVCRNPVNTLLHGSSGTGKEVLARMIHAGSKRKNKPFVAVNCAAIPENLMESEFFGYEKGAFTGADSSRGGYFEEARGGTLFLDEIGDMPIFLQPKLLRAIQEEEGRRLGSTKFIPYDVRIISATNKDLLTEVKNKRFRKDLYYRIFSVEIKIPPLQKRKEDIVPLAFFFLNKVSKKFDKKIAGFSPEILVVFEEYSWPGNVRQLLHEIERLVAFTPDGEEVLAKYCSQELLDWRSSPSISSGNDLANLTLHERIKKIEITSITEALRQTRGKKLPAAKLLGITRVGLDNKIKRYGIDPSSHASKA